MFRENPGRAVKSSNCPAGKSEILLKHCLGYSVDNQFQKKKNQQINTNGTNIAYQPL
jgi:hypothetical protein